VLEVAARWREHVDVGVLAPPQATETVRSFLGDVPTYELGSASGRRAGAGPLLALEYVRRTVTTIARTPPPADVVVAASHFTPDAAGLAAVVRRRGALGVAYVYHLVAERRDRSLRTLWSKNDERVGLALLRRHAEIVFASNAPTAAALARRGVTSLRTAVGVDLAAFRQSDPLAAGPKAAFLARMAPTKGVTDAIEAWAQVRRAVPEARLVMVGSGPERERATALAERLRISDSVEWPGFVSEEEKRRILGGVRLFIAPSYEEGWGISVCEALASGVPVVGYRLPVLDELFGSAYLGAPPGDVSRLADLAVKVLTDDAVAETLSRRGRETAERYDVHRVAEQELEAILSRWTAQAR
jgi:glycosyltransferase involved in cell wall biosynthesis